MFRLLAAVLMLLLIGTGRAHAGEIRVGAAGNIRAWVETPTGSGPFPALLVLSGSSGVKDRDLSIARTLAGEGYVAVVPYFLEAYGTTGKARFESFTTYADRIVADLASAVDTVAHRDGVRADRVGAIGYSNGGFFTTWLAAQRKIAAGVSYYGALTGAGTDRDLKRFETAFEGPGSPLLLLVGTADNYNRATHHLVGILKRAGSPFESAFYEGAHHEFDVLGAAEDKAAAEDAWVRTRTFLAKYLKAP
jgi:carboxymethylenebutenolidase